MKNILIFLFYIIIPFSAFSQQIGLQECLQLGIENNFDIRISKNRQILSDNNATKGNAGMLPTIGLSSNINSELSNYNQYPANGDEKIKVNNSRTDVFSSGINLNWSIFEGFNAVTNYERLQELQKIGELNTQNTVENFIANMASEYYNLIYQNIRYNTMKSAVALSKERLRIVEARYQIGSLSMLDLQQARVDFNTDSSRLMQQFEEIINSKINLINLIGITDTNFRFINNDTVIKIDNSFDYYALRDTIEKNNILIKISEKEKNITQYDITSSKSQKYPYLRLNSGFGYNFLNYNKGNYNKQDNWGPNIGLTLGFNIFDGYKNTIKHKNSIIENDIQSIEFEKLKFNLNSQFNKMWLSYKNKLQLIDLENVSLNNALKNYEIAMERYKLGDLSGLQLREAQNSLLDAKERLTSTIYSTKIYEISLLQISGRLNELLNF